MSELPMIWGPYSQQSCIVFEPAVAARAVAVAVHGGGWLQQTDSDQAGEILFLCQNLVADAAIRVVSINYRPSTAAPWPAQLFDVQLAVRWARAQWPNLPVGVVGTSAGAQMALAAGNAGAAAATEAAVDPLGEAALYDDQSSAPSFVISVSAPTDLPALLTDPNTTTGVKNDIQRLVEASPITPESAALAAASPALSLPAPGTMPPIFNMHGQNDPLIPFAQAQEMLQNLQGSGNWPPGSIFVTTPGKHVFGGLTEDEKKGYVAQMATFVSALLGANA